MGLTDPLPYVTPLKFGSHGPAVEASKRAVYRFLDIGQKWQGFVQQAPAVRRTFGPWFVKDVRLVQGILSIDQTGRIDKPTLNSLVAAGSFDAPARELWLEQFGHPKPPPSRPLIYPYPLGEGGGICQGLHPTAGLIGNWAIDFCDAPGARVLAVEAGTIQKLSGHPPSSDVSDAAGTFGWNTYIRTPAGYVYFVTHLGWQNPHCRVGSRVIAGTVIGTVGDQRYRPDHCHYGVTSPLGPDDAKRRITLVSQAPRITIPHAI